MLSRLALVLSLCVVALADEVHKKRCSGVDTSQCVIHSASVEPCPHGPRYCSIISDKRYSVNVNFTPYFYAHNLKLAVSTDHDNVGSFSPVKTYKDACSSLLTCPLEAHVRQSFDIPLTLDKIVLGKFPVQVKLWNAEDESQACCFTFRAKIKQ